METIYSIKTQGYRDKAYEDIQGIIENHRKFQYAVRDFATDSVSFWVDEYLTGCPCDWQIGSFSQGDHFSFYRSYATEDLTANEKIYDWLKSVQEKFELLSDEYNEKIDQWFKCIRAYNDDWEAENANAIWENAETLRCELETAIYKRLQDEYDATLDNEYLTDFVFDYDRFDNLIYDRDSDRLYKHVEYDDEF